MPSTTTANLFIKHPQWIEEATEGTLPASGGSFTSMGAVKSASIKINGNFVDVAQLGAEDLIAIVQGNQEYETSYTLTPINGTDLFDRLFDAYNYGTPTGTVNKSISILFSIYLNGTENFIICKGSKIKDGSVTMEIGKETEVSVTFTHMSITTPNSSSGTTSTTVGLPSGAVYDWLSGGATPFSWNGGQLCKKVTININRNSKPDWTLGNLDPHSVQPHGRRISGDATILWTGTALETDFKAGTPRTLALTLKTSTSVITLTGTKIVDYSRDGDIGSDEAVVENITFRALSCTHAAS